MTALTPAPFPRMTPAGSLLAALVWVSAVATAPTSPVALLPAAAVAAWLVTRAGRVERQLRLLVPASLMVAGTTVPILATVGVEQGAWVAARAMVAVTSVVALLGSTPAARLGPALRGLGLPPAVTTTMASALRQSALLVDEARQLLLARRLRGDRSWATGGRVLGALFSRAVVRAERMDLALALRGHGGTVVDPVERPTLRDAPAVATTAVAGALLHGAARWFA